MIKFTNTIIYKSAIFVKWFLVNFLKFKRKNNYLHLSSKKALLFKFGELTYHKSYR